MASRSSSSGGRRRGTQRGDTIPRNLWSSAIWNCGEFKRRWNERRPGAEHLHYLMCEDQQGRLYVQITDIGADPQTGEMTLEGMPAGAFGDIAKQFDAPTTEFPRGRQVVYMFYMLGQHNDDLRDGGHPGTSIDESLEGIDVRAVPSLSDNGIFGMEMVLMPLRTFIKADDFRRRTGLLVAVVMRVPPVI